MGTGGIVVVVVVVGMGRALIYGLFIEYIVERLHAKRDKPSALDATPNQFPLWSCGVHV